MKTYIELIPLKVDEKSTKISLEVGSLINKEDLSSKPMTEAETVDAVKAEAAKGSKIVLDEKEGEVTHKVMKHVCYHDARSPKPCTLEEVK
jgi:hypothetical protein